MLLDDMPTTTPWVVCGFYIGTPREPSLTEMDDNYRDPHLRYLDVLTDEPVSQWGRKEVRGGREAGRMNWPSFVPVHATDTDPADP
jgi:hypothetical protein